MRPLYAILLSASCAFACKKREAATPAPPPADAAPAAVGVDAGLVDAAPERGGPDDPLAEKLRHCPLTVDGARTTIEDVDGGVALTVTADADAAIAEIRRRAAHLVAFTSDQAARKDHGGGDGGGFMRNCPVVTKDTRIATEDLPRGARLVVQPAGELDLAGLRAETRRRYADLGIP